MTWTIAESVWLIELFKEHGAEVEMPVKLVCDNKEAPQIVANPIYPKRTKHIEIKQPGEHKGLVKTVYVSSKYQQADILSKGLLRSHHKYLLPKLGVVNIFAPTSLRGSVEI